MNTFLTLLAIIAIVSGIEFVLDRWIIPWRSKKIVEKLIRDIQAAKPSKPRDYDFGITFNSTCFVVSNLKKTSEKPISMTWTDITRVVAFKRDLFTTDRVCLMLLGQDGIAIEVDEEMKGWREFTEILPTHLPGCKPGSDWFWAITTPAFARNETEIFLRDENQKAEHGS